MRKGHIRGTHVTLSAELCEKLPRSALLRWLKLYFCAQIKSHKILPLVSDNVGTVPPLSLAD